MAVKSMYSKLSFQACPLKYELDTETYCHGTFYLFSRLFRKPKPAFPSGLVFAVSRPINNHCAR